MIKHSISPLIKLIKSTLSTLLEYYQRFDCTDCFVFCYFSFYLVSVCIKLSFVQKFYTRPAGAQRTSRPDFHEQSNVRAAAV